MSLALLLGSAGCSKADPRWVGLWQTPARVDPKFFVGDAQYDGQIKDTISKIKFALALRSNHSFELDATSKAEGSWEIKGDELVLTVQKIDGDNERQRSRRVATGARLAGLRYPGFVHGFEPIHAKVDPQGRTISFQGGDGPYAFTKVSQGT